MVVHAFLWWFLICTLHPPINVLANDEIVIAPGSSIQEAVNNAQAGSLILLKNGTYLEDSYPIIVNKTLTIRGENADSTIIDGKNTDKGIFVVKSNGVRIAYLTVRNTFHNTFVPVAGVHLADVENSEILNCIIEECMVGVLLKNSSNCIVARNRIYNNSWGILLREECVSNIVMGNTILNNNIGLQIASPNCFSNSFYHNNFVGNNNHLDLAVVGGVWDRGYPFGGNFWDDYLGIDEFWGLDQNNEGSDGIGDQVYQGIDEYPLMGMIQCFRAFELNESSFYIVFASNSTIENFNFNPSGAFIEFEVTGPGFCRIIIPKQLLWVENNEQWSVFVNSMKRSYFLQDDATYTYFYFNYDYGFQTVRIEGIYAIQEFSLVTLILTLAFFLFVVSTINGKIKCLFFRHQFCVKFF